MVLCSACYRHFRPSEARCPFCGGVGRLGAPKPRAALAEGTSRSRRYAARAVLLAGATASCSGSTTGGTGVPDGDAATSVDAGGASSDGGASGRGGALAAGGRGSGGTGPLVPGRACPGFVERDATGLTPCQVAGDCPPRPGYTANCVSGTQMPCGPPPPGIPCQANADCPLDWTCSTWLCGYQRCSLNATCTEANCSGTHRCSEGVCFAKDCDEPGALPCDAGFVCSNEFGGPARCVPQSCTQGYACPAPLGCAQPRPDAHGCGGNACRTDADCACGFCVSGQCSPELRTCDYQILAMPYGCVWPDEELV